MKQRVIHFINKLRLLDDNHPVIVGVSGGKDSVVLLHLLKNAGYTCIVAHCNFHLRGNASDEDEKFVLQLGESYGCITEKIDFNTKKFAEEQKISIEMAARELRYTWFEELKIKYQAQAIVVGHHADDNAETILLNLIRGTGLKGLTGIKARNGHIVRPLLCVGRHEIEAYISQYDLKYRDDASNAENVYTRNKIRNQVIPLLESINPSFRKNLNETGEILNDYYIWSTEYLNQFLQKVIQYEQENETISVSDLKTSENTSLLLYHWLSPAGYHADIINQLNDAIHTEEISTGKIFESDKYQLLIDRNKLILSLKKTSDEDVYNVFIDKKNILPFALSVEVLKKDNHFKFSTDDKTIHLDADKLSFPLTVRKWKKGDSFQPLGMKQRKKISDYLIDKKINLFDKEKIYVMLSQNEIVWLVGQRIDDRYKITSQTKNILEFRL